MKTKSNHKNFVHLVGLYTYCNELYFHLWGSQRFWRASVLQYISYRVTKCIWDLWDVSHTRLHHIRYALNIPFVIICDTTVLPARLVGSVTSRTAVNGLCRLGQSLLCRRGLCQASSHHVEHSGVISVIDAIVNRSRCGWQPFVVIPPYSASLYSCFS